MGWSGGCHLHGGWEGGLGRGFGAKVELREGCGLGAESGGPDQHVEAAPEGGSPQEPWPLHNAPNTDTDWLCPRPGKRRCFLGCLLPQGALL